MARSGYQPIINEDDSDSSGSTGTTVGLRPTALLRLQLDFYSLLVYFISKEMAISENKLLSEAELEYAATEAVKNDSPSLAYTIQVFRGTNQFKDDLDKEGGPEKLAISNGASFMDFIITFFRSAWQVLSNVLMNFFMDSQSQHTGTIGNDDRDNPNSSFNQYMYKHNGDPASGLSPLGYGAVTLALVSPLLGLLRGVLQIAHKLKLVSFDFYIKQRRKVSDQKQADDLLEDQLHMVLMKAMKDKILTVYSALTNRELPPGSEWLIDKYLIPIANFAEKRTIISWVWDRLSNYSYIFWIAWMPVAMICGLAAANGAMLFVPVLIAIGLGTVLTVINLKRNPHVIAKVISFAKKIDEITGFNLADKLDKWLTPAPDAMPDVAKAEFDRLAHEAKLLDFINSENAGIRSKLEIAKAQPRHYSNAKRQPSLLREHLVGNIHERRGKVAIAGLRSFINGLLMVVFIAWFGSSILACLGATTLAGFIGDTPFGGIGGVLAGIVTGVVGMAQVRKAQIEHEQKVHNLLLSSYKGSATENKEQAFERLYAQVEYRKSLLRKSRAVKEEGVADYLDKVDVFNDRYFEKFEHNANWFTWVKKGLNRAFEFVFGGQTGAFTARFFLLKGGLLAGAIGFSVFTGGAALIPFLIGAAVLIALVGTLALIDYQMKASQGHRENFLNTLDARLYYLETKNEELCALQIKHKVDYKNAGELITEEVEPKTEVKPIVETAPQVDLAAREKLVKSDRNVVDDPVDSVELPVKALKASLPSKAGLYSKTLMPEQAAKLDERLGEMRRSGPAVAA